MTEPGKPKPWSGRRVTSARAYWSARLAAGPMPCALCGRPVHPTQPWVVEHLIERSRGGNVEARHNQGVSHRACSDRSGGQLGARSTPTVQRRTASNTQRGIRGI